MELTLDLGRRILRQQTFRRLLGARLTRRDRGRAELSLGLRPDLLQQDGLVHGGVVCGLAGNAPTCAGGPALGTSVVTSGFKINYLRPAIGRNALARAEVVHRVRRRAVCRCDVRAVGDTDERLVATAPGTSALAAGKSDDARKARGRG